MDNKLGHGSEESGSSDSDHSEEDKVFKIREKGKMFNCKKHLVKFVGRQLRTMGDFDRIECCGNSYDEECCRWIANLIGERGSDQLNFADFSNMFVTR